jgi:hypothetical protein
MAYADLDSELSALFPFFPSPLGHLIGNRLPFLLFSEAASHVVSRSAADLFVGLYTPEKNDVSLSPPLPLLRSFAPPAPFGGSKP